MRENLFSKPKLQYNKKEEKSATWIELFYDLAYVAAVSSAGHYLHDNLSFKGSFIFLFMFISIWILWVAGAYYANWFETNDIVYRSSIFIQITGIVGLAVFSHDIMKDYYLRGFIISYIIVRISTMYNYIRAAKYNKSIRFTVILYLMGHGLAFILWTIALFLNIKYKFYFLVPALFLDYITPFLNIFVKRKIKVDVKHLLERFGLFSIIVLGEIIVAIVNAMSSNHIRIQSIYYGILGVLIVFLLWWVYFGIIEKFINHFKEQYEKNKILNVKFKYLSYIRNYILVYGHLTLHIGLIMCSVGIKKIIKYNYENGTYRFLCYGLFITFLSIGLMEINAKLGINRKERYIDSIIKIIISFILLSITFLENKSNIVVMVLIIILCSVSILADIIFFLKREKI